MPAVAESICQKSTRVSRVERMSGKTLQRLKNKNSQRIRSKHPFIQFIQRTLSCIAEIFLCSSINVAVCLDCFFFISSLRLTFVLFAPRRPFRLTSHLIDFPCHRPLSNFCTLAHVIRHMMKVTYSMTMLTHSRVYSNSTRESHALSPLPSHPNRNSHTHKSQFHPKS